MAHTGTPWSAEEDKLLIQAVSIHGEVDQWKAIAFFIPGRTNKACRKRWLHSLSPSVKKSPWTPEEDATLTALYAVHGTKWSLIARSIPGRTDDACSKRYREALDPALRKDEWAPEEDEHLLSAYARVGGKWGQIGQELQRSGLSCRNRWRMMERKKATFNRSAPPPEAATPPPMLHSYDPITQLWSSLPQLDGPSQWPFDTGFIHTHISQDPHAQLEAQSMDLPYVHHQDIASASNQVPAFSDQEMAFDFSFPLDSALALPSEPSSTTMTASTSIAESSTTAIHLDAPVNALLSAPDDSVVSYPTHDHLEVPTTESSSWGSSPLSTASTSNIQSPYPRSHTSTFEHAHPFTDTVPSWEDPPVVADGYEVADRVRHGLGVPVSTSAENQSAIPAPAPEMSASLALLSMATSVPPPPQPNSSTAMSSHYRSANDRTRLSAAHVRAQRTGKPLRLSSSLALTNDPSIIPYACGYPSCLSRHDDASTPSARTSHDSRGTNDLPSSFATSAELSEHVKSAHENEIVEIDAKPFRCALPECGKSWKSANGLQYHLQISKAHFRTAIATALVQGTSELGAPSPEHMEGSNSDSSGAEKTVDSRTHKSLSNAARSTPSQAKKSTKSKKTFPCLQDGCLNVYKQLSGLRYHLSRAHPHEVPTQIDTLPPTLARLVAGRERTGSGT